MTRRILLSALPWFAALPWSAAYGKPQRGARYRASRLSQGGEDSGKRRSASEQQGPVVFDLISEERWPIRGLDPVLRVGGVEIENYSYANSENTVLRFTCYEPGRLVDGSRVYVQYGHDTNSRTDLPEFWWSQVS
jgi:hypothetical protein